MSGIHARLSPSGADGWMGCTQWTSDSVGSTYARRGTAMHEMASQALLGDQLAGDFMGAEFFVDGEQFVVDEEMADLVQTYLDYVLQFEPTHNRMVEVRVPIGHVTGEVDAHGTVDALLLARDGSEIAVVDLKTGRGHAVEAENNKQLMLYALGALEFVRLVGHEPETVRLVIVQPPVSRTASEWTVSVAELEAFAEQARAAAAAYGAGPATPGDAQCRWCSRKAACGALAARVQAELGAQFADLTTEDQSRRDELVGEMVAAADVATALAAVDLIEAWCSAIRTEAERRLHQGVPVAGFKLVAGKRGQRSWSDADAAEQLLVEQLKEQAHELRLISPAAAEKLLKRRVADWKALLPLISQTDGKPTVAPMSDKRPALEVRPVAELFHDETGADLA